MTLLLIHVFFAGLAAFRLTTLFNQESIWEPVRRRLPVVPWGCMLCMSVWGGIIATGLFLVLPWLNWPLALSWLYLAYMSWREGNVKKVEKKESIAQQPDQSAELNAQINAMMKEYEFNMSTANRRCATLAAELASTQGRLQAAQARIAELEKPKGA